MTKPMVILDGNEAAASVAYRLSEVIAIYPITPASAMGEWSDEWAQQSRKNIWNTVPRVVEMQSEAGAAGALHGAIQTGALGTTFTASQGLLLMIPNMYKIAGELTPTVIHVAARSLATHALSIFGDHSDVMAARSSGFAMLAASSVQEAQDMAAIAHAATLTSRIPFLHFFDGFRTSHELSKIFRLSDEELKALIDPASLQAHRERALTPEHPSLHGTAQNPDVFFQQREAANPFHNACPVNVQTTMNRFAEITGRQYHLFDYIGAPDADRVLILMGSAAGAVEETLAALQARGEKVGLLKVRLYRPFAAESFLHALPTSVRRIAVLDRTKEPGANGEPLYMDVVTALAESNHQAKVVGGRYGLSSKEFTPAMAKVVFDELKNERPRNHFTIGINDDVTFTSLAYDEEFSTENPETTRAIFYGLGSDGTVGANKNSIKIIGEETDHYAQGYFVYDSKKSGSVTVSHLRFGPDPIQSTYLIRKANFIGCHQFQFLQRMDVLQAAEPGATFFLNSPFAADQVWRHLPRSVQEQIIAKRLKFFVIDGNAVARETDMGSRINTIMQTCFFAISGVLPREEAIAAIKSAIRKTYGKRGDDVVQKNFAAVDATLARLQEVQVPETPSAALQVLPAVSPQAPRFVRDVLGSIIGGRGDDLPVSAIGAGGVFPTGTSKWEKRNIAQEIPVWDEDLCIQCGKCVLVCPHAAIRANIYEPRLLLEAPPAFKSAKPRWREFDSLKYSLQVAPEDCTGCELCVAACPVTSKTDAAHKALDMRPQPPLRETEKKNWEFFQSVPPINRAKLSHTQVKDVQLLEPLFEFSGACSGCGETPYIKLLTQLFGDRALIANATGCSSIYGGNLPTTPYTVNADRRGPAWSNSLFEDNAEFGLGMRLALDKQNEYARELLGQLSATLGSDFVSQILSADQSKEAGISAQREHVAELKRRLDAIGSAEALELLQVADSLIQHTVWIVGGDGWAYDIGFGGLDHVLSSGANVNILVLDTEVYSNTGGQRSKATPRAAVAKFAAGGKFTGKKDLALQAVTYGNVYVARVALGANDTHTVKTLQEAEAFDGPSLVIAYGHCIAHGLEMCDGLKQQKAAVLSGYWPLMHFDPRLAQQGKNPFQLDSRTPTIPFKDYAYKEARYAMLSQRDPEAAKELLHLAEEDVARQWKTYEYFAARTPKN